MSESALEPSTILRIAPMFRFQWEPAQDCHVLLYPEGMVKLSGSAGEILKRVDGRATVAEIIAALEAAYPGAELALDVRRFLDTAHANGWVRHVGP